jgi:hypothetical protein
MFIGDWNVTVIGDRLVTVYNEEEFKERKESHVIEVRLVHTGQVLHTIHTDDGVIICVTPVPGHSGLLVTGHRNGAVHLWDIEKGARACACMNVMQACTCAKLCDLKLRWMN